MKRKLFVIIVLAGCALAVAGCKKKEQAIEVAPAAAPQAAAPQAAAPAAQAGSSEYGFEDGIGGWTASDKSVKLEQASDKKHGGNASLKISGASGSGRWNFANTSRINLEPGKKYLLTGWMNVEAWDKADLPPLMKVGVNKNGKWQDNAFTSKYNLKKMNEWQKFAGKFTAPADGNVTGSFSLEKGTQDSITATVYLDDIKLEQVK
jgi:hypothetical protein